MNDQNQKVGLVKPQDVERAIIYIRDYGEEAMNSEQFFKLMSE